MKKNIFYAGLLLSLISCQPESSSTYNNEGLDSTALQAINADSFKEAVSKLASDEFLGRQPFTKGDTLTVNYIEQQFKTIGLKPGNGDSYFQEVPLVEITTTPKNKNLIFKGSKGQVTASYLQDYVIGSSRLDQEINVSETQLVFAGFGIVAPEYKWNDYEGLDVKGKTVIVMVGDPGKYDKNLFKADTMTYYGRWTYKFEEAARQGATGVLIIHETAAASYDWNVVRNGWTGPQLDLINDGKQPVVDFKGWISQETAKKVFGLAGIHPSVMDEAKKTGFKPIDLNISTAVSLSNQIKKSKSNNVIAKIEGTKRPDEVIVYSAHWDHLGVGESKDGDSIFNGALDNATGVAALFEIAKAFQAAKVKPERTIVFLSVTGEEEGLLGSAYYAENPIYPIKNTVANLNIDMLNPIGPMDAIAIVGLGQTELEDYAAISAKKFNRTITGDGNPSSGFFYRSDHFSFVKKGIPGLYFSSGGNYLNNDLEELENRKKSLSGLYHTVKDEINDLWDYEGMLQDMCLFFDIGYTLSFENTFPNFKPQSEFKELGDKRLSK